MSVEIGQGLPAHSTWVRDHWLDITLKDESWPQRYPWSSESPALRLLIRRRSKHSHWRWRLPATNTIVALRSIVHALRGWPTPLGATINSSGGVFNGGKSTDAHALTQLQLVGRQVCEFARLKVADPSVLETNSR
jgi:hypothetical protein